MSKQVLIERFFETLISGNRAGARQIVDECVESDVPAESIIEGLFWPTLDMVEKMFRQDQLSILAHNYATRLLRMLTDQMQMRLRQTTSDARRRVLLMCGPTEPNELGGQMAADLLEAGGHDVTFGGGGVANDEIVAQIGQLEPDVLILFSSAPDDLPHIRALIDRLHEIGTCPNMQIVVGGGVFNRAPGLAEEIGADVWAITPIELVAAVTNEPGKRMADDQRTVGRRRRGGRSVAA